LSRSTPLPSPELIMMVRTLAEARAVMPRKHRGAIRKEYGVSVEVNSVMGIPQYTAGGGALMTDFRFIVRAEGVRVRSYKPGDWELAIERAYDDLLAGSGVFAGLSVKPPEPMSDAGGEARPADHARPLKKGVLDRLMGVFIEPED
jgi:hypothetical protein